EMDDAVMPAQHPAVEIDNLARLRGAGPQPLDDVGIAPRRHEADVLAVVLVRDRQIEPAGKLADLAFRALAEREAQMLELLARGREQEIALVALQLARAIERAFPVRQPAARDIMAGRQHARAALAGGAQRVGELGGLVA